jgi:RING finger protein 170
VRDMPFLLSRFFMEVRNTHGTILLQHIHFIAYIICLIVYLLSPFDLVPEMIFGAIGFIDDLIVVVYVVVAISSVFY